jgi:hypothetical protein
VEAAYSIRVDGGGGLWWPEPTVVVAFMHVGGGLTHVCFRLLSLESVQGGEMQ